MVKFIIFLYLIGLLHPVHVSLLSIDYNRTENSLDMFLKVFSDDLELDCRLMEGDDGLRLYDMKFLPDRSVIQKYVNERLVVEAGKEILFCVVGNIEADNEEVRIYAKYVYKGDRTDFRIINTIMADLYEDQSNLLIFRFGDFEEGYKFTASETEIIINADTTSY